jgi:hypothetical protein
MNIARAIALLEARIGLREVTNIESEEVEAWLNTALQRLGREKFDDKIKDYQIEDALTLGLDGSVALPEDAFEDSVSRITHESDTYPFVMAANREEMDYDACGEYSLATVENRKIYTKPKSGVAAPLSGDINVTYFIIPTIGGLLDKDEGRFMDLVVEIAHERIKINPIGRDTRKVVKSES